MLHPDLDALIRHIRSRGMMAGLITNGYFLVPKRIEELNAAGLDFLQISIDNVEPDEVSKKSLRAARQEAAAPAATTPTFDVNINSVLGGGIKNPEDARTINNRARELGFSTSIGIIHDGSGRLKPLGAGRAQGFDEVSAAISGAVAGASRTCIRGSAASRTTWRTASRTSGAAAPARATSTSARTAWCTTARSSAAIPGVPLETLHDRRHPPRVRDAEVVRAVLHGRLRAPRVDDGLLAVAAGRVSRQSTVAPTIRLPSTR